MKKIVNTVLVLILVVLMALIGFVYYAWVIKKRSRSAAESMIQTNLLIDKVRQAAMLDNNYTNSIRDMLLMNQATIPAANYALPDSMLHILQFVAASMPGDTVSQKILDNFSTLLRKKINYNRRILDLASSQPALARQLAIAPENALFRDSIRKEVNDFMRENRTKLIARIDKDNRYTLYSFWTTITISLFTLVLLLGESRYLYRMFKKQKQRNNQLYKREQSFLRLAEETELILYKSQVDGIFTYVSKRAAEMTGYTNTELVGKHYSMFLDEPTWKRLEAFYMNQVKTGDDYTSQEFEIITRSGTKKWVEQMAALVYGEDGRVKEFQCIVRDIDKEKRSEDQVMYLQERLDAIIDYMPSMMFIKDMPGKYLLVNNRFSEVHGIDKKDIIGKTDAELPYDWVQRYTALDREVITSGTRVKSEQSFTVNDKIYHFLITKFPLRNAEGEMIGICGIGQDFTEKNNYIAAIENANNLAQEAISAQEMFLANMSHEIRTPMNGIIGMTNLLMQQSQLSPLQLEYTGAIKTSANRLLVIINEILDFSKIKAGKLLLLREPFDIYEVMDNALFPLKLQAQQKGLSFFDEIDKAVTPYLLGDEVRLQQILTNLVENAIKFTPAGKISVKVSLVKEDANALRLGFEIKDTGIGIDPAQHELIFKSFSQTHADNARKYGGTGLGLAITRELITLQHGFIRVNSQLNEGATFYFELPFDRNNENIAGKDEKGHLHHIEKPLQGKTILVVEDDDINQQVVFHTLRNAGARTDVVNSGKWALEILDYKQYDCIIMDIQMPGMDGYQATQAIRAKGIQTYMIAMTASALKGEKERCLEAGMNDYISKPFDRADLFHKILKGLGEQAPEPAPVKEEAVITPLSELNFSAVYSMMSGEKEHVKIMLEELMDSIPQKFSEMSQLVAEKDWQPLYMLAHQMKFNLNMAGMQYASEVAWSIERDARLEEHLDSIPDRLQEIMNIYYRHVHLVKAHIDQA
ncbi:PAS domain S-box protein [Chitinophaga sp. OAE865]|uniref:hybrid sensor histidine kinase/response regulator n=1 Tax=Chitinophaga sp. OAE865 TaxID=2817898 RepID=UPI001AE671B3